MYDVKQSTALTIPIFVHDANGDAVTGLVDAGFTKRISKNGGAFAAMTVTITEMENGWYSVPVSTSHSDTVGILSMTFTHGSAKQVNLQFRVQAKLTDDLNDIAATDIVSAGAITTLSGAVVNVDTVDSVTGNVTVGTNNDKTGYSISGTKTTLDALNDVAATDIVSAGAITTLSGAVVNVDTVDTCTTNTDMRGTDSALLAASAPANFGDLAITVTTGLVSVGTNNDKTGYSISGAKNTLDDLNDISTANVNTEVVDALTVDTISEPAQGVPEAAPTIAAALGRLYGALVNKGDVTATFKEFHNSSGVVTWKKGLSDDGSTYSEAKGVTGP